MTRVLKGPTVAIDTIANKEFYMTNSWLGTYAEPVNDDDDVQWFNMHLKAD